MKTDLLNLLLGGATYFAKLFSVDVTDVFRLQNNAMFKCIKITQIGSFNLKMWAVKQHALFFGPPYIYTVYTQMPSHPTQCCTWFIEVVGKNLQ